MNPMNHLDAKIKRAAERAAAERAANGPPDTAAFAKDDHQRDGTIRPSLKGLGTEAPAGKPPLGVKPRILWIEERITDLTDATARYAAATIPPPADWAIELEALTAQAECENDLIGEAPAALRVLSAVMQADPDYARTWHNNIAMAAYDTWVQDRNDHTLATANRVAERFMQQTFGVDTSRDFGRYPSSPGAEERQRAEDAQNAMMAHFQRMIGEVKLPTSEELANDLRQMVNWGLKSQIILKDDEA